MDLGDVIHRLQEGVRDGGSSGVHRGFGDGVEASWRPLPASLLGRPACLRFSICKVIAQTFLALPL